MIQRMFVATVLGVSTLFASSPALSDLYVSAFGAFVVGKYDEVSGAGGILIPDDGNQKFGLAIGPDGNLYVAGPAGVTRHDATTGALLTTFETAPPSTTGSDFRILTSVAFGPNGRLYVADYWNGEVLRYDSAIGSFVDVFLSRAALGFEPHGLAFTPEGTSLMVSSDLVNRIRQYDATTGAFEGFFTPIDGLYAAQIAFGPDGNLYVPDFVNHNVRSYDGDTGAFVGTFASGSGLTSPFGLVFGSDGDLYVSSGGDDRIYVFDGATGSFLRSFATDLNLSSLTYLAFSSPIPEPRAYLLWMFAIGAFAMRLCPRLR